MKKYTANVDVYKAINEELEKLERYKHAIKDLNGTIRSLENELKKIQNDIRTISESQSW